MCRASGNKLNQWYLQPVQVQVPLPARSRPSRLTSKKRPPGIGQDGCSRNRSLRKEVVMIAATDTGVVPMRVSKAVWVQHGDDNAHFMVLDELDGDRHLVIQVCLAQAFDLAA